MPYSSLVKNCDAGWVVNNSPYQNSPKYSSNKNYFQSISEYRNVDFIVKDFVNIMKQIILNRNILKTKMNNSSQAIRARYNIESLNNKWETFLSNYY